MRIMLLEMLVLLWGKFFCNHDWVKYGAVVLTEPVSGRVLYEQESQECPRCHNTREVVVYGSKKKRKQPE